MRFLILSLSALVCLTTALITNLMTESGNKRLAPDATSSELTASAHTSGAVTRVLHASSYISDTAIVGKISSRETPRTRARTASDDRRRIVSRYSGDKGSQPRSRPQVIYVPQF